MGIDSKSEKTCFTALPRINALAVVGVITKLGETLLDAVFPLRLNGNFNADILPIEQG